MKSITIKLTKKQPLQTQIADTEQAKWGGSKTHNFKSQMHVLFF